MLTPKMELLIKKRVFQKDFCTTELLLPYLDAGSYRSVEGGKLIVSLIALLQISFSAHIIPEVLFKIMSPTNSVCRIVRIKWRGQNAVNLVPRIRR